MGSRWWLAVVMLTITVLSGSACGQTSATSSPLSGTTPVVTPNAATRPSSPAVLTLLQPTKDQVVTGGVVHVAFRLDNAHVVPVTSTHIRPDEGHVHLYLASQLIYMQYQLEQDVPVHPGVYSLKGEFVAGDHFPFNPRVWSNTIFFTVQ